MNCTDHCSPTLGQLMKCFNDRCCSKWVQTSGGLIQENEIRVSDELDSNRSSLPLSPWHSLDQRTSNLCVLALIESQFRDDIIHSLNLALIVAPQLQLSCEFKTFTHSHCLEEDIVLLHIGGEGWKSRDFVLVHAVHVDLALFVQVLRNFSTGKVIQESCFTGT